MDRQKVLRQAEEGGVRDRHQGKMATMKPSVPELVQAARRASTVLRLLAQSATLSIVSINSLPRMAHGHQRRQVAKVD